MKITVSKHTTIDWQSIGNEIQSATTAAIEELIEEAKKTADQLKPGASATVSANVGRITIRKARD